MLFLTTKNRFWTIIYLPTSLNRPGSFRKLRYAVFNTTGAWQQRQVDPSSTLIKRVQFPNSSTPNMIRQSGSRFDPESSSNMNESSDRIDISAVDLAELIRHLLQADRCQYHAPFLQKFAINLQDLTKADGEHKDSAELSKKLPRFDTRQIPTPG